MSTRAIPLPGRVDSGLALSRTGVRDRRFVELLAHFSPDTAATLSRPGSGTDPRTGSLLGVFNRDLGASPTPPGDGTSCADTGGCCSTCPPSRDGQLVDEPHGATTEIRRPTPSADDGGGDSSGGDAGGEGSESGDPSGSADGGNASDGGAAGGEDADGGNGGADGSEGGDSHPYQSAASAAWDAWENSTDSLTWLVSKEDREWFGWTTSDPPDLGSTDPPGRTQCDPETGGDECTTGPTKWQFLWEWLDPGPFIPDPPITEDDEGQDFTHPAGSKGETPAVVEANTPKVPADFDRTDGLDTNIGNGASTGTSTPCDEALADYNEMQNDFLSFDEQDGDRDFRQLVQAICAQVALLEALGCEGSAAESNASIGTVGYGDVFFAAPYLRNDRDGPTVGFDGTWTTGTSISVESVFISVKTCEWYPAVAIP